MKLGQLLGFLSASCLLVGCADRYSSQIRDMKQADVKADVRSALAEGDRRFVGVHGLGTWVPGVDGFPSSKSDLARIRTIPNTSDGRR
jgi:hypothetical protein